MSSLFRSGSVRAPSPRCDGRTARLAGTVVAAGLLYAGASAPGRAAVNWNYDPRVEVGGTYDDNYLLGETPALQTAVAGPFVDAQVALHGASPRNDFVLTPLVHATLYPGHSEDQSTDGYLTLNDTYDTLRTRTVLKGIYANQTIVAADFLPATFPGVELGQAVISNSGQIVSLERQQSVQLDPSTSIRFSDRGHLDLGADYYRAWFNKDLPGQIDFQSETGTVGIGYSASQRSDVSLRGSYTSFDPSGGEPSARHAGLDGEWDYVESKIMRVYVRAGAGVTRGNVGAGTESTGGAGIAGGTVNGSEVTLTDFEGGIGARWTYQVTQVVVDLLRTAVPSSFGVLVNQDELRFRATREFSPMIAGFIALRGIRTVEAVSTVSSVPNRSYATGSLGLEWRMTRDYSLETSYTYAWQKFQNDPLHAASNAIGVSIVYEPNRLDRPPEPGPVGSESPY